MCPTEKTIVVGGATLMACGSCRSLAVWQYAPSGGPKHPYYCDDHVPRESGCSCNAYHGPYPEFHPKAERALDTDGRELPCVEYWYDDDGFEPYEEEEEEEKP